jgi:hypothetical protein
MERSSKPSANAAGVATRTPPSIAAAEYSNISRRDDFKIETSRFDWVDGTVKPSIETTALKKTTANANLGIIV